MKKNSNEHNELDTNLRHWSSFQFVQFAAFFSLQRAQNEANIVKSSIRSVHSYDHLAKFIPVGQKMLDAQFSFIPKGIAQGAFEDFPGCMTNIGIKFIIFACQVAFADSI